VNGNNNSHFRTPLLWGRYTHRSINSTRCRTYYSCCIISCSHR